MMLTDREWLRFVSFAIVVGAVFGALYTGALIVSGRPPVHAMTGAVIGSGAAAIGIHLIVRYVLDRYSTPTLEQTDDPAETQS